MFQRAGWEIRTEVQTVKEGRKPCAQSDLCCLILGHFPHHNGKIKAEY